MTDNVIINNDATTQVGNLPFGFEDAIVNGVHVYVGLSKLGYGAHGSWSDVTPTQRFPVETATIANEDPIFDHTNGTKASVTTSATIITPPAGCKYMRIVSDTNIYVNTAGATAVDDGTSILILANNPEIIPVTAGTAIKALSASGTAVVRCTPMKVRA